jgi:hypothetical protein
MLVLFASGLRAYDYWLEPTHGKSLAKNQLYILALLALLIPLAEPAQAEATDLFPLCQYRDLQCRPGSCEWAARKCGYVDRKGTFVIPPQYDDAEPFSDGLAAVEIKDDYSFEKWGFINFANQIVIPPQHTISSTFENGVARFDGRLIDHSGKPLSSLRFELGSNFSEGLSAVKIGNNYGYMDRKGGLAIPAKYYWTRRFSEGLAAVTIDGWLAKTHGYIDPTGNMVFETEGPFGGNFMNGVAAVQLASKKHVLVNRSGARVGVAEFDRIDHEGEGLWMACQDGKCGYIDALTRIVIPLNYETCEPFHEGLARVMRFESHSYDTFIDKTGKVVIDGASSSFVRVWDFYQGRAMFEAPDGKFGLMRPDGSTAAPAIYDSINGVSDGMVRFYLDGKEGYVDFDGHPVVTADKLP